MKTYAVIGLGRFGAAAAARLEELGNEDAVALLSRLEAGRAADVLDAMQPDDAADLVADLPQLKAAELLGVPIDSCLVLEDAASGYTAARRAGAQVLLVGNGVPEADPGTLRIPDFTGVTFTIH